MKQDADKSKTDSFSKQIAAKEKRKLKALGTKNNVWFGLGVMGMVGWSVVVPALAGVGDVMVDTQINFFSCGPFCRSEWRQPEGSLCGRVFDEGTQ